MSESKSFLSGCKGLSLTADEKAFFRSERPWGFILFGRNIGEPAQVADLTAEMRDTSGVCVTHLQQTTMSCASFSSVPIMMLAGQGLRARYVVCAADRSVLDPLAKR